MPTRILLRRPFSLAVFFVFAATNFASAGETEPAKPRSFTIGKGSFLLDGKPITLICGEMRPQRKPANLGLRWLNWPCSYRVYAVKSLN